MRWVVVGAGSAGCVVAARLAARADTDVTLLEAGAAHLSPQAGFPSYFDALAAPGRTFPGPFVRGRGLGGSSAVNGMVVDPADAHAPGEGPGGAVVPLEPAADDELGPIDRALLDAATDARRALLTRRDGVRVTPADAFLTGVDRVRVVGDAEVARIVVDGVRTSGVELADGSVVDADRVVLCAGAIGTPAILLRSGLKIAGVGEGLRNHPGVPVLVKRRADAPADAHGLVTGAMLRRGDVQILALNHLGPLEPGWGMLLAVVMRSSSRGSVRLDAGPGGELVLDWALDERDRARLAQAALMATQLTELDAFREVIEDVQIGESPAGVFHWASTCAIGRVLDARGAVIGHEHLYVADASAFPDLPPTNPYLPTLAQAASLAATW
jgi:choline dehydrogenase-like flavoprotein